jgi:DNA-binding XRE family transcriptional regulator
MEERLSGAGGAREPDEVPGLPLLPGFREMALRRMSAERRRLVADLTAQRRAAGLSQTEVAARMGTSQSAVARLETGDADVRVSTLERYAAAIGSQVAWQARPRPGEDTAAAPGGAPMAPGPVGPELTGPGLASPGNTQAGNTQAGNTQAGNTQAGNTQAGQPQTGLGQEHR